VHNSGPDLLKSNLAGATSVIDEVVAGQRAHLPLVSVIIPYYKQAAFILETVMTVKQQTYPNIELIVVDDGSPVPAAPALSGVDGFALYEIENSGCPGARNYGFERSSGEYLVFLDGDDLLEPNAIEMNLELLQKNPKAIMSFGAVRVIDSVGKELIPARVSRARRNYFALLLETNPIWTTGATLIRRDSFVEAGMFKALRKFQVDDYELYLHLARVGTFVQHDRCVLDYRRHGGNMSNDKPRMLAATLEVLDRASKELSLSAMERIQLRHGRQRWINASREHDSLRGRCLDVYFRCASVWNLRTSDLIRDIRKKRNKECGCEPTHIGERSPIVFSDNKGTDLAR
jgi:glycosyltransferase involved in cell wall biosynthesis